MVIFTISLVLCPIIQNKVEKFQLSLNHYRVSLIYSIVSPVLVEKVGFLIERMIDKEIDIIID